ncbi:hypothetical protein B9G54_03765 [Alloscardovia macacae]|uniref:HD domain-containing protein n=1 Tax=Alloscardovia macacae TaxID=1160091 RepID=A0A1Y2SYX0_9BIFI|nr:HD domain-containing protein [Alloscardovia macacae]OTA26704.1 hypothetical protein B9G54_03765 [Alloscardovia macacae]OTA29570.1 hypothetical protein B9T39_02915 [Alloscardovia macacae]
MTWDGWSRTQTTRTLYELHQQCAQTACPKHPDLAYDLIGTHSEIVAQIAVALSEFEGELAEDDANLLVEGALAHDIGTYSVLRADAFDDSAEGHVFQRETYIQHGLRGYQLLLERGLSQDVALFARNHTGVGLTRADCARQKLPIPCDDYVPGTRLQELVTLADKFHTKSVPAQFVSPQTARSRCEKFGEQNLARWDALSARCCSSHAGAGRMDSTSRTEAIERIISRLAQQYGMSIL